MEGRRRGRQSAGSVLSATRLHFPAGTASLPEKTVQDLRAYAKNVQELRLAAAVAVNCLEKEVEQIIQDAAPGVDATVLHVPVWGAFVPALNTLLGEAQRRDFRYVMYQSLEVKCSARVLSKMLDHHMSDTLVVGPVMDGHVFEEGMKPLNGRSCPWNTLALWNTRKLALTGFLSIADGLPRKDGLKKTAVMRQISGEDDDAADLPADNTWGPDRQFTENLLPGAMGSDSWWASGRQMSEVPLVEVPAGVEEVTVVALLQHLLGHDRARAILVRLPPELVEWKATFVDERRKQWHEYKMASKVARPAAQIKQLFQSSRWSCWRAPSSLLTSLIRQPCLAPHSPNPQGGPEELPDLHFGVVMHFGESIRPPWREECLCMMCFALFSANFTAYFASAFQRINEGQVTLPTMATVSVLIGGVYIPIPVSLYLTRMVVSRLDHRAGLAMFTGALLISHSSIVLAQLTDWQRAGDEFLMATRLLQGMGAGVLFQARFVLSSLSTRDHHLNLQARCFFVTDLGLAFGAVLPFIMSSLMGYEELPTGHPELLTSAALACLSLALLLAIVMLFPRRLHRLPSRVRFPDVVSREGPSLRSSEDSANQANTAQQAQKAKVALLVSGTARVFVQSAVVVTLALWMRDAGMSGHFMQTKGMAALLTLPLPFRMLASRNSASPDGDHWHWSRVAAVATVAVVVVMVFATNFDAQRSIRMGGLDFLLVALEMLVLLIALSLAVPLRVSLLYELGDTERTMVTLEWLKAYVGRLIGPAMGIALQSWLGYRSLVLVLCAVASCVALTA